MESRIIVYRKVVPEASIDETIKRCLVLYQDRLRTSLSSEDIKIREYVKQVLKIEEMLARHSDAFLPERFKGKSYSRLRAVYAFPFEFPEEWCYPNLVPANKSFADGETVVRMIVDGPSSLVLPMYEIDELYNNPRDSQGDMRRIKAYWESAVSLEEFARDFVNPHKSEYEWYSKDGTKRIEKPEVIVPEWSLEKITFLNVPEIKI